MRRLEVALYVAVASLLAYGLLERLQSYAELAERAAVQATLANLQTALQVEFILDSARTDPAALAKRWRGGNPIALVGVVPPNYLGERAAVDPEDLPGGTWVFDRARGELVYAPRNAPRFGWFGARAPARPLRFALTVQGLPEGAGWSVRIAPLASSSGQPD